MENAARDSISSRHRRYRYAADSRFSGADDPDDVVLGFRVDHDHELVSDRPNRDVAVLEFRMVDGLGSWPCDELRDEELSPLLRKLREP